MSPNAAAAAALDRKHKLVVFASSLGTVFEWYDFYIYGTLAAFFGKLFFPPGNETAGFLPASPIPCFGAGTRILCAAASSSANDRDVDHIGTYVPVEQLTTGMLVKTCMDGWKPIVAVGSRVLPRVPPHVPATPTARPKHLLYRLPASRFPELLGSELLLTGAHAILVADLTPAQRKACIQQFGELYATGKHYRLFACLDDRADVVPYAPHTAVWHFALANEHPTTNYGVYANGVLVESCSIRMMKSMM